MEWELLMEGFIDLFKSEEDGMMGIGGKIGFGDNHYPDAANSQPSITAKGQAFCRQGIYDEVQSKPSITAKGQAFCRRGICGGVRLELLLFYRLRGGIVDIKRRVSLSSSPMFSRATTNSWILEKLDMMFRCNKKDEEDKKDG
jgi:hypothetical protein